MVSSGMCRRVALVRTDVLGECIASFVMVTRIGELGLLVTANVDASPPILLTMMMEALSSSEMSVVTRATRSNTVEDDILNVNFLHQF
jgi:hypothetical protein